MDAQQLITMAREYTASNVNQIPDVDWLINWKMKTWMLSYLNFAYRDFISQVTNQVNEDRYADIFIIDLNQWQIEYTIPTVSSTQSWLQNILWVSVNYTLPVTWTWLVSTSISSQTITWTWTQFTVDFNVPQDINININIWTDAYRIVKIVNDTTLIVYPAVTSNNSNVTFQYHKQNWIVAKPKRQSMLEYDIDYYIKNQPYDSPFYIIYDTWCRIYPQPTWNSMGWLKLYWTTDPIPLVLTPTPTSPIFDSTWHYILPIAMKRYIFWAKLMAQEKNDSIAEYQSEFIKAISSTSERQLHATEKETLSLTQFQ